MKTIKSHMTNKNTPSIKELQSIIKELKTSDSLTPHEVLKMDMYDYYKELIKRAQKELKRRQDKQHQKEKLSSLLESLKWFEKETLEVTIYDKETEHHITETRRLVEFEISLLNVSTKSA